MTDPATIAAGFTPNMRKAFLELQPTLEWQAQPTHKGNKSASLCFAKTRTIGQDCYAELGRINVMKNMNRTKPSDPFYQKTWKFTKLGLTVRQHIQETSNA